MTMLYDRGVAWKASTMPAVMSSLIPVLIAALSAQGISEISNIDQIDRGYQDIEGRLKALGAQIDRVA